MLVYSYTNVNLRGGYEKVLWLLLKLLALLTSTGATVLAETEVGSRAIASSCPYGTKHKGVLQGIGIVRYESTNKIFDHYGHYLPTWEFFSSNNPLSIESEGM